MWRFGWVFYLISLFFMVAAFFAGFLACCGRLGSAISGLVSLTALFFYSIAAALMTYVTKSAKRLIVVKDRRLILRVFFSATFVKARDAFLRDDRTASLGKYAFGFTWGAWAALLIATVLFFMGARSSDGVSSRRWRRTRSTRSRRSFEMGPSRVKDNYA